MKGSKLLPFVSLVAISSVPAVAAWGAVGHEIVATIAQIYLHPVAADKLCDVLPEYAKCHLAPIATWADNIRYRMRWSAPLHYVNGVNDHPSDHCVFGTDGWQGKPGVNVLAGIENTTSWIENGYEGQEEALKFLVHFMGDVHQPLHLVGRDKGGNGAKVRFDGRITNLHSVWDSYLIAKSLRTIPRNYTRPLPSERVESALRGTIYDPYIRQIVFEGIIGRFKDEIPSWTTCPEPEDGRPPYTSSSDQVVFNGLTQRPSLEDSLVCPFEWAKPLHQLNCDIIWPPELDNPAYKEELSPLAALLSLPSRLVNGELDAFRERTHYLELDTPEYSGRIKKEFLIEKLLAMGGVRLAATLNALYAFEESMASARGLIDLTAFEPLL